MGAESPEAERPEAGSPEDESPEVGPPNAESLGAAVCLNCGAPHGGGRFCMECGQSTSTRRLAALPLLAGAWANVANLDTRFLRTVTGLSRGPGRVAREYVEGRRLHYFHPVQYAILTSAFWWFGVFRANDANTLAEMGVAETSGQLLNLVMIPFIATGFWAAFARSGRNYAEHLVFALFAFAQIFAFRGLLAFSSEFGASARALQIADSVFVVGFMSWALVQFHRGSVRWLALRVVAAFLAISLISGIGNKVFEAATGIDLDGDSQTDSGGDPRGSRSRGEQAPGPVGSPLLGSGEEGPEGRR